MQKLKLGFLLVTISLLGACSSDSGSSDSSSVAGSSIDSLPANTDPVISSSSSAANLANPLLPNPNAGHGEIDMFAAATGLKLSEWADTNNWQSSNSRAMCEVGQGLKDALGEAMNPDKIKCYVGAVAAHAASSAPSSDGSDFFMQLENFPEGDGNFVPRIRLQMTKNSSGLINDFKMWSCFEMSGSNHVQSEYISQEINDTNLSITSYSKHVGTDGSESYGGISNVTGTLNSSYQWVSKDMTLQRYYNGSQGSHSQDLSVTQRASSFVVSGYNAGTWGQDRFSNAFYAAVQGLSMSSPKDIALGDGTASFNLNWCIDSNANDTCDGGDSDTHTDSDIQSWDGDNRTNLSSASDGDYHSEVSSATVPSVSSVSAISFSGDEVWDCSADSFESADLSNMEDSSTALGAAFAACDAKYAYEDEGGGGYACDAAQ